MDYDRIDINQCPPGLGNKKGTNLFADTARCKKQTTEVSLICSNRVPSFIILFSVSRYTVGVFEEGAINVAVNQVGVFPCKFVDLI
jgi:hypothetical protein